MASICSLNINEILPGLEDFLRTMSISNQLDLNQRQLANMYLEKIDQFSQQQTSMIDDDFTDEEDQINEVFEEKCLSISSLSSNILADGYLLTYEKDHQWISRYYILDNYDLICYLSENPASQLWLSDMTNAKIQLKTIEKNQCICLQIGLKEEIYLRPSDPKEIKFWLKAFREASALNKSKPTANVQTISHHARRLFSQINRKKGQFISHFLHQNSRKHYDLRGFLVISFDNLSFQTKYCTIIDGIFRIHKSRLSDQTDNQYNLTDCILAFPEERTRDIQFVLIEKSNSKIFIRGNHIYTMGRLLNTLAKYVEIQGSLQSVFEKKIEPKPRIHSLTQETEITYDNQFLFNHSPHSAFTKIEPEHSRKRLMTAV